MSKPSREEMVEWLDNIVPIISVGFGEGIKTHGGDCYKAIRDLIEKIGEWKTRVNNSRGVEESVALKLVYEIRDFREEGCDKSSTLMDKCKGFDTKKEGK